MQIQSLVHEGVKPDGTFDGRLGAIETDPLLRVGNGCNLPSCHCSDGPFMTVGLGRDSYGRTQFVRVQPEPRELVRLAEIFNKLAAGETGAWEFPA